MAKSFPVIDNLFHLSREFSYMFFYTAIIHNSSSFISATSHPPNDPSLSCVSSHAKVSFQRALFDPAKANGLVLFSHDVRKHFFQLQFLPKMDQFIIHSSAY